MLKKCCQELLLRWALQQLSSYNDVQQKLGFNELFLEFKIKTKLDNTGWFSLLMSFISFSVYYLFSDGFSIEHIYSRPNQARKLLEQYDKLNWVQSKLISAFCHSLVTIVSTYLPHMKRNWNSIANYPDYPQNV